MNLPYTLLAPTLLAAALAAPFSTTNGARASLLQSKVAIRPYSITENRHADMNDDKTFTAPPSLMLTLELQGDELAAVTHWYGLKVDQAKDDRGTDLTSNRSSSFAQSDTPQKIDRKHMWFALDEAPEDRLKLELSLRVTPRVATQLEVVTGSVMLRSATMATVSVSDLTAKSIRDEKLEAAGVTVEIKSASDSELKLDVRGNVEVLSGFKVLDGAGEGISNGSSSFSGNGQKQLTVYVDGLPKDAKLQFQVVTSSDDRKVPFRVEGVKLP